jgi:hypothetical protein
VSLSRNSGSIANQIFPSEETLNLLEQATSVKNAMFKNSRAPTTNVGSMGSVANNAASNFNLSFTGPENASSPASLKARGWLLANGLL